MTGSTGNPKPSALLNTGKSYVTIYLLFWEIIRTLETQGDRKLGKASGNGHGPRTQVSIVTFLPH